MGWAEAKWIVDTLLQKVGQAPKDMQKFKANPISGTQVQFEVKLPANSYIDDNLLCTVAGLRICASEADYPATPGEGTMVFDKPFKAGSVTWITVGGLKPDVQYFFTAFPYSDKGVFNMSGSDYNRATATTGARVFGISRDVTSSSPDWARTENAVGMTAKASIGDTVGSSDFDAVMPWAGIKRETLATGDVVVKIPRFYYKRYREDNVEHLQIAEFERPGYTVHPAFNRDGVLKDYIYVGAYQTCEGHVSVKGKAPLVQLTRSSFRTSARAKGSGWGIFDISAWSAIQMLIMVEFATNNVQAAIGFGLCDSDARAYTGAADEVPNLTGTLVAGDITHQSIWRGIEGLWGNIWEWVDGVNVNAGEYYVCNSPALYADDTATGYIKLSYKGSTSWAKSYITEVGLDTGENTHIMLPSAAGKGSDTTYLCDGCWTSAGWRCVAQGGCYSDYKSVGLFAMSAENSSTVKGYTLGSRLLYIP